MVFISFNHYFIERLLPESASWLITQERYEEAYDTLCKIARVNGKHIPEDLLTQIKVIISIEMNEFC
jgi:hypothetical protein